jgi:hypothetical protein
VSPGLGSRRCGRSQFPPQAGGVAADYRVSMPAQLLRRWFPPPAHRWPLSCRWMPALPPLAMMISASAAGAACFLCWGARARGPAGTAAVRPGAATALFRYPAGMLSSPHRRMQPSINMRRSVTLLIPGRAGGSREREPGRFSVAVEPACAPAPPVTAQAGAISVRFPIARLHFVPGRADWRRSARRGSDSRSSRYRAGLQWESSAAIPAGTLRRAGRSQ